MKTMKKLLSAVLCIALLLGVTAVAVSAKDAARIDYTITNPYASVDFSAVQQYKTALHTHTNASDGSQTPKESLERHYLHGFDIVATTDHGICNESWIDPNYKNFAYYGMNLIGRHKGGAVEFLGKSGTFKNGEDTVNYEVYTDPATGDEYLRVEDGKEIMRIPYGIENNAVSINAHVNSWFADFCDNTVNDYESALRGVQKAGGLCVINHPGEYTKARKDLTSDVAYNYSDPAYRYYMNKFYHLIMKYDACLGLDINSKGDSRTRYDRELWDFMLERASREGKNVYAVATSDAHKANIINSGYTRLLLTEKTSAAAKADMESGAFFPCSYYNGNQAELECIAAALKEYYGENDTMYQAVAAHVAYMQKNVNDVLSGKEKASESAADPFRLVDGQGYYNGKETYITDVIVDNDADTITIKTENAKIVRFIANGKQIAAMSAEDGTCTLDLNEYADEIGCYVRAEAFGMGGTVYTQAFILSYDGAPAPGRYPYCNLPIIDALFAEVRRLGDIIKIAIGSIGK